MFIKWFCFNFFKTFCYIYFVINMQKENDLVIMQNDLFSGMFNMHFCEKKKAVIQ